MVGASIVRDLAALNGRELLPWDYWGLARTFGPGTSVSSPTASRLDEVAGLTAGPTLDWPRVRTTYRTSKDLRVPPIVLSYPEGTPREVSV